MPAFFFSFPCFSVDLGIWWGNWAWEMESNTPWVTGWYQACGLSCTSCLYNYRQFSKHFTSISHVITTTCWQGTTRFISWAAKATTISASNLFHNDTYRKLKKNVYIHLHLHTYLYISLWKKNEAAGVRADEHRDSGCPSWLLQALGKINILVYLWPIPCLPVGKF